MGIACDSDCYAKVPAGMNCPEKHDKENTEDSKHNNPSEPTERKPGVYLTRMAPVHEAAETVSCHDVIKVISGKSIESAELSLP